MPRTQSDGSKVALVIMLPGKENSFRKNGTLTSGLFGKKTLETYIPATVKFTDLRAKTLKTSLDRFQVFLFNLIVCQM